MFVKTLFVALALAATTLAKPTGQSIVKNKCRFPVYVTSVDHIAHRTIAVAAGGTWSEPERYDPLAGIAIKISTNANGLYDGKPVIQFAYTAIDNKIYYDLSASGGFDRLFKGHKIVLEGSAAGSPKIIWNGTPATSQNTKVYSGNTNLILYLCA